MIHPLRHVGDIPRSAEIIKSDQFSRDSFQHEAVMGDQDQRTGEFKHGFFKHLERWNVEIIRRFIHQQDVRRLEHEIGDEQTCLFATGEKLHAGGQLIGTEQKLLRPTRDMNHSAQIVDGITNRTQGLLQRLLRLKGAPDAD